MIRTSKTMYDSSWYPNSEMTNVITTYITNLMTKTKFFGPNQVHMGNGKGLSIKYIS